jgi:hypothetical protein
MREEKRAAARRVRREPERLGIRCSEDERQAEYVGDSTALVSPGRETVLSAKVEASVQAQAMMILVSERGTVRAGDQRQAERGALNCCPTFRSAELAPPRRVEHSDRRVESAG